MSRFYSTPIVSRAYCPGCETDTDPFKEILDTQWCQRHEPKRDGLDDRMVRLSDVPNSGTTEVIGTSNQLWCKWVHRSRKG